MQWYLEQYLLYPRGEFKERAERIEKQMVAWGEALFEAVFAGPCGRMYHRIRDFGAARVVVHASDNDGVAIPWELMRYPDQKEYGMLAHQAAAFVRSQPKNPVATVPNPGEQPSLNILMVICRPGGSADVPFQTVVRPLLELFRPHRKHINLDVLSPPTLDRLAQVLAEKPGYYHIVHFDGHGVYDGGRRDGQGQFYGEAGGVLAFEDDDGTARMVPGKELGAVLAANKVPAVLLNACQSGMAQPEAAFTSVANNLIGAGVRGVVAMSYSVYVRTAVKFMARLYQELIAGRDLGRAVTLAREHLRLEPERETGYGRVALQDWMVPVLFERGPFTAPIPDLGNLRLDPALLEDQQAYAQSEIDTPDPPRFGLVGRDGLVLEIWRALRREHAVLLKGMAGVGKTELAVGYARFLAETGQLGGPIFFTSFEHHTPLARVIDRVGAVFGPIVKQQLGTEWALLDGPKRRALALDLLKQVPCLLVWDNFEPVAGFPKGQKSDWSEAEQQELREFLRDLRGGRSRVLVTSRRDEPVLGQLRTVDVTGLKPWEAQELAVEVLRAAGLQPKELEALPDYSKLLGYLDGNPLAIQLILPELKRHDPQTLLTQLQAGQVNIQADDAEQGRSRSLSASLNYRVDALDPEMRRRLGVLGMFQGFVFTPVLQNISQQDGAPAFIAGRDAAAWMVDLDAAAEVGLVRKLFGGGYSIHPALPWFLHDLMEEAFGGQREWLTGAYCAALGNSGSELTVLFQTNTQTAVTLLRLEEANLLHALRLARRTDRWEEVKNVLYGINKLWNVQGRWAEWDRLLTEVEADAAGEDGEARPGRDDLWVAIQGHKAELAEYRRDFTTAKKVHERLRAHYGGKGDERNEAVVLHQLGRIAQERGDFEEAEKWYRQSLAIEERIGNEHGQAATLHQLGMIAEERRDFDEAETWYRQSLAIEERIGHEHGQAATLHQLGNLAYLRRDFGEAEKWYRQSLAIKERIGDEHGQAQTLGQLGLLAAARQDYATAARLSRQAEAAFTRLNDPHTAAMARGHAERLEALAKGGDGGG